MPIAGDSSCLRAPRSAITTRGTEDDARTLLSEPLALLLDEPFSRLDARLRTRFRAAVLAHARSRRLPTLLVTHDPADAAAAGGAVVDIGTTEDAAERADGDPLAAA